MIIGVSWVNNWLGEDVDLAVKEEKKKNLDSPKITYFLFLLEKKSTTKQKKPHQNQTNPDSFNPR